MGAPKAKAASRLRGFLSVPDCLRPIGWLCYAIRRLRLEVAEEFDAAQARQLILLNGQELEPLLKKV